MHLFSYNRRKVTVGIQMWCDLAGLWQGWRLQLQGHREECWIKMWDNESPGQISPLQMDRNCCMTEITFKKDLQGLIRCFILQERRLHLLVRSTSGWRNAMTFLFWEATGSTLLLSGKNCAWSHQTWWPNNATVVLSNLICIFLHSN